MTLDCGCKGISHHHTRAARAEWHPETADELYALSLAYKKSDPDAKITGLEDNNGTGFNCGRCRSIFEAAVQDQPAPAPVTIPIIMMHAISSAAPPRIGQCGNDCNTCTKPQVAEPACQPQGA